MGLWVQNIADDRQVKRLFDVNSKWLGKRGTNNDWDDKKQTFLQCSNSLLQSEGHIGVERTLEISVFHS